jgi:hypothetical protein
VKKNRVGLWDHVAVRVWVCVSAYPPPPPVNFPKKLMAAQILKKLRTYYGIWEFITVFIRTILLVFRCYNGSSVFWYFLLSSYMIYCFLRSERRTVMYYARRLIYKPTAHTSIIGDCLRLWMYTYSIYVSMLCHLYVIIVFMCLHRWSFMFESVSSEGWRCNLLHCFKEMRKKGAEG